jgi:outer membrane protein assembly factor BamB
VRPEGVRIGCIVEQDRLVWLDPEKAERLWTYQTTGDAIVGRPRLVEDVLVVALQSGRYIGLDPLTGKSKGTGYTLRASAAPAASPRPFGSGRLLAPLSDGTALLLSLTQLEREATPSRERQRADKPTAP